MVLLQCLLIFNQVAKYIGIIGPLIYAWNQTLVSLLNLIISQ